MHEAQEGEREDLLGREASARVHLVPRPGGLRRLLPRGRREAMAGRELVEYADRPLKIGSFSAASNVTGIGSRTRDTAVLLHAHGALSFWDFAAAAPYVRIEMGEQEGIPGSYKDAVFLSPHKFIGGPGTPGVLIAKRSLFANAVPAAPGGGTVSYVNAFEHRYLDDVEHREEGGTPEIIGAIRAGLVFQLKEAVGHEVIREREERFVRRAIASWSANPNLRILGNPDAWRLSIVSFMVRFGDNRWLHHNFVVAVLNDLFGIQARGGCSCAGPYGHRLLGIDWTKSKEFEREVVRGCEGIKPGWTRLNFNYFISDEVADFIIEAVHLVANRGAFLLPDYDFTPDSGLWRHRQGRPEPAASLHQLSYRGGRPSYPSRHITTPEWALPGYLDEARQILADAEARQVRETPPDPALSADFETLRWFPLPSDCLDVARDSA